MRTLSAKVLRLADRQWGRVSAAQFAALGVESVTIARWVSQGYLFCVLPRVYAVGHRAPSVEADLTAAVLYAGPGAMLSHATALCWRGLIDKQPRRLQVTTPRRCRSSASVMRWRTPTTTRCSTSRPSTRSPAKVARAASSCARRWSEQRVIVELDGKDNHSSWSQIQRDRSNELKLRAAGFDVLRYGTLQLKEQPEPVAADLLGRVSSPARSA
jgi:Protein of unknown function (DUF559)